MLAPLTLRCTLRISLKLSSEVLEKLAPYEYDDQGDKLLFTHPDLEKSYSERSARAKANKN